MRINIWWLLCTLNVFGSCRDNANIKFKCGRNLYFCYLMLKNWVLSCFLYNFLIVQSGILKSIALLLVNWTWLFFALTFQILSLELLGAICISCLFRSSLWIFCEIIFWNTYSYVLLLQLHWLNLLSFIKLLFF
jgi:hypothetical protein